MKFNMTINELVEFISGATNSEEVKRVLAGAFVALANDPVVEASLRQRISEMAEQEFRKVLTNAVSVEQVGWNQKGLRGWAASVVKLAIDAELKDTSVDAVVRQAVTTALVQHRNDREAMVADIRDITEKVLMQELPSVLTLEYASRIASRYDEATLRALVAEEVVNYMRSAFKG